MQDGQLSFSNPFGERVVNRAAPIARIVVTDFTYARYLGERGELWVIVDAAGRGVLRLHPEGWEDQDVERLAAGLDVPLERRTTVSTAAALRREFPGVMPWWLAHLGATTVGVILVLAIVL